MPDAGKERAKTQLDIIHCCAYLNAKIGLQASTQGRRVRYIENSTAGDYAKRKILSYIDEDECLLEMTKVCEKCWKVQFLTKS